jgi:hypothetical protein
MRYYAPFCAMPGYEQAQKTRDSEKRGDIDDEDYGAVYDQATSGWDRQLAACGFAMEAPERPDRETASGELALLL